MRISGLLWASLFCLSLLGADALAAAHAHGHSSAGRSLDTCALCAHAVSPAAAGKGPALPSPARPPSDRLAAREPALPPTIPGPTPESRGPPR